MHRRTTVLLLVILCVGATMCFAADPNLGTWKLNEAKSKIPAGATKNVTVTYEAAGDSVKVTVDGVDGKGNAIHNVWTGKYDGKDYPVVGDTSSDTRSVKKVNDQTLDLTGKKDGKVVLSGKIVVATDGKSRTLTAHASNAEGKKLESVAVYDKQ